jgi:hypothetical protein
MVLTLCCAYGAYHYYEAATELEAQLFAENQQLAAVERDVASLQGLEPKPLKAREETIEEFLGRLIDDSELLGSSVRLNVENGQLNWEPVRYGVEKARVSLSSAAEGSAALGYFSSLWQLIQERPVNVLDARIDVKGDVSTFNIDVELFALAGEGS